MPKPPASSLPRIGYCRNQYHSRQSWSNFCEQSAKVTLGPHARDCHSRGLHGHCSYSARLPSMTFRCTLQHCRLLPCSSDKNFFLCKHFSPVLFTFHSQCQRCVATGILPVDLGSPLHKHKTKDSHIYVQTSLCTFLSCTHTWNCFSSQKLHKIFKPQQFNSLLTKMYHSIQESKANNLRIFPQPRPSLHAGNTVNYIPYVHPVSEPPGFYKYAPSIPSHPAGPLPAGGACSRWWHHWRLRGAVGCFPCYQVHPLAGLPWPPSAGSATLWGHAHSCQQRKIVHSRLSHGCCQQAQQLYGITHTAVNRKIVHSSVSHGCCQQAQQLYGVTHTAVNRKAVYSQVPHGCCQQAQQLTAHLKYRSPNTKTNRSEGV